MHNHLLSLYVQGFYGSFLYTHTFPEDVKDEIFDFFYLHFKGLKIKAVELWASCFFKPKFACLTFVESHCHNVDFIPMKSQMGDFL